MPRQKKTKSGLPALTVKQELFVQSYLENHNATLAAIEAGYSKRSANVTGSRLLNASKLIEKIEAYGQYGIDRLAVIAGSGNTLQAERAAEALVERAYGKAKNNVEDKQSASVTINITKLPQQQEQQALQAVTQAVATAVTAGQQPG